MHPPGIKPLGSPPGLVPDFVQIPKWALLEHSEPSQILPYIGREKALRCSKTAIECICHSKSPQPPLEIEELGFPEESQNLSVKMFGNVWKCLEMFGNVWKCLEPFPATSSGWRRSPKSREGVKTKGSRNRGAYGWVTSVEVKVGSE